MKPPLWHLGWVLGAALLLVPHEIEEAADGPYAAHSVGVGKPSPQQRINGTASARRTRSILSPELIERAGEVARIMRAERLRSRESRQRRDHASWERIFGLEAAEILRPAKPALSIAGVEHEPFVLHKQGLPFFNRQGRLHRMGGQLTGRTGLLSFPLVDPSPHWIPAGEALAIARDHAQVNALRAQPRVERGWLAVEGASIPAWRVQIPALEPFGTWQVVLDGRDGSVLSSVDLIRTAEGTGRVYDPNVVLNPTPTLVPLHDLDDSGQLFGAITRVIDDRAPGAFRPDLVFDFPTTDPRFIQTNVYRGLTDTGRFAVDRGFPSFPEPVLAFADIGDGMGGEFNNAFYDPFFPLFAFGNGDGVLTSNLGVDLDVAAHEMGHHVFEVLVLPLFFTGTEPVAAMTEGVADTFSAFLGGDPNVGESTIPGQPYLRTINNTRSFPDDVFSDPHETGLIYAGANWDLMQSLGSTVFANTLVAGLPFLPSTPYPPDYRDAVVQGDQVLTGGVNVAAIQSVFTARGFDTQEDPPEFKGYLEDGLAASGTLVDGGFDFYFFEEFPPVLQIDFETQDAAPFGDADLAVGPLSTIDFDDPSTFLVSENFFTSDEFVQFTTATTPSVEDDDVWIVFVVDYPDGVPSGYTLVADSQLPVLNLSVGGPPLVGSLTVQGEFDVAAFTGTAGQVVRLEAESLSPTLDPLVGIVDPDDFSVLNFDDDSGPGTDSLIQGTLLAESKTYTVITLSPAADVDPAVGTGDYRLTLTACVNTGTNTDGDALVDACDDDDDNDTVIDSQDSNTTDALMCQDFDSDSCDDCSGGNGPDILADGTDTDSDILCDAGDIDDDNDGCEDGDDLSPLTPSPDDDLDFLGDDCDNCPAIANADQADTDGNGEGNACDSDDDGDGLEDSVETNTGTFVSPTDTGTNPLVADSDGDGFSDGDEVAAGTNPNSAASFPGLVVPALGGAASHMLGLGMVLLGWARLRRNSRGRPQTSA